MVWFTVRRLCEVARTFLFCFLTEPRVDKQWQARVWLSRIPKFSGGRFRGPPGRGHQQRSWITRFRTPNLMTLCNICYSHLKGNFVETSALNLIITFDRADFHQSVEKSLVCQYYYHCYWLEKLAPNKNSMWLARACFPVSRVSYMFIKMASVFHASVSS